MLTLQQPKNQGCLEPPKYPNDRPDHARLGAGLDAVAGDVFEEAAKTRGARKGAQKSSMAVPGTKRPSTGRTDSSGDSLRSTCSAHSIFERPTSPAV
jgi:hypothetical protein